MSNQKTSAVELFRAGFAIFPLLPDAKIPPKCWHWSANAPDCAECGHQAGTAMLMNSQEEVEDWWTQYPDDNIGVNCKESCLLAIDLDSPDAARRYARTWTIVEGQHPNRYGTPIISTPRGWHYYHDLPDPPLHNTVGQLGEGIDTRAAGGMIVAPGSVIDGRRYRVVSGDLNATRPVPGWLDQPAARVREPRLVARPAGRPVDSSGCIQPGSPATYLPD